MKYIYVIVFVLASYSTLQGQTNSELKLKDRVISYSLNKQGSHYIRFTALGQFWLRYTDMNPGSQIFGNNINSYTDMGIRRLRFQLFGQLTDHVFFYTQFGQNNFSIKSPKYSGSFFHDALGEIKVKDKSLSIGMGLTAWSGLSRYSSPSVGSLLSLDAPLYQQTTNGLNDQFIRRFTLYAKGQVSKIDYRMGISFPFASQTASTKYPPLSQESSSLSVLPPSAQLNGYFKYQFFEEEKNITPYQVGTYLGKKKVLAIGSGFTVQDKAITELNTEGDTIQKSMVQFALDLFLDLPIKSNSAITAYAAYHYLDYGKNFLVNGASMNPATGTGTNYTINGSGNGFPMIGTGHILYSQIGYLFGKNILTKGGKLQPYLASQYALFDALDQSMIMYEGGLNWLLQGSHNSKLSLNIQERPIFKTTLEGTKVVSHYRGMIQLQLQVSI